MRFRWLWFVVAAVLLGLTAFFPPVLLAQSRSDAFRTAECMFDLPAGLSEGTDVECGYVQVPEQYDSPNGPQIELAVAIFRATGNNPAEPLFFLQGGPGGSTIDTYTSYLGIGRLAKLQEAHDLVLFDQRGTLYSRPVLHCSEFWQLTTDTIEERLTRSDANMRYNAALAECRSRLAAEGINLGAYDSLENADDVDAVRAALGYDTINIYGVSYGSLLALHVMRQHPGMLRSVMIDAIVPTQTNFIPAIAQSQQRAFSEFFAACTADAACDRAYPNLEQTFFDLVARLNKEPARIALTDSDTGTTYNAVVDGDTLESWLFQLLYASDIIPALPAVIYQANNGNYRFFSQIMPQIVFDQTLAYGMYNSVVCAEDADYTTSDVDLTGVRPELAEYAVEDAESLLAGCRIWDVPALDTRVDDPVTSTIPTLIMNGRFDPITPPSNGVAAAQTLSQSYNLTFGYVGHGALTTGACAEGIAAAFLADPSQAPDSDCIAEQPNARFLTPANTRFAPNIGKALQELNQGDFSAFMLPLIGILFLLTIFPIWIIALIIRAVRNTPGPKSPLAAIANWVVLFTAIIATVTLIGLVAIVATIATTGDIVVLFGLPNTWGWILFFPWLCGAFALVICGFAALAWRNNWWSIAGRIYYSLLAIAAIAVAAGLIPLAV
jgi:pimeloyl-ACP methyl ester carboxylesterase